MSAKTLVLLPIVSALCFMSPVAAQDLGSPHDLSLRGMADVGRTACDVCHVQSQAQGAAPAWMSLGPAPARYQAYGSDRWSRTLDARVGPPDGSSLMCLSCHDGTTATEVGHARPVGVDLGDDHPISFVYDGGLAARDGFLADPSVDRVTLQATDGRILSGTIEQLLLEGGKIQCVSCHDVHDRYGNANLLKITDRGSILCETCHLKG